MSSTIIKGMETVILADKNRHFSMSADWVMFVR